MLLNGREFIDVSKVLEENELFIPSKSASHEMIHPDYIEYYVEGVCVEPFAGKHIMNEYELDRMIETNTPLGEEKFYFKNNGNIEIFDPKTLEVIPPTSVDELVWVRSVFSI